MAGCFGCLKTFPVSAIEEYTDDDTAVCPHCGIDSVLDELDSRVLAQMQEKFFKFKFNSLRK